MARISRILLGCACVAVTVAITSVNVASADNLPPASSGSPQAPNASSPQASNASAPQAPNASSAQASNASSPPGTAQAPQANANDGPIKDAASASASTSPDRSINPNGNVSAQGTSAGAVTVAPEQAGPGPLLNERKALLNKVLAAKKQGIGIGAYLAEFNRIEGMVKAGQPTSGYQGRIESLTSALDEQLRRGQLLKVQRLSGPSMSSSGQDNLLDVISSKRLRGEASRQQNGGGFSDADLEKLKQKYGSQIQSGMSKQNGAGVGDADLEKLKQKYGNQIPGGTSTLDKLGPDAKEKFLQSDVGKELVKKFLGN